MMGNLSYRTLIMKSLVQFLDKYEYGGLEQEQFMFFDEDQRLIEMHISCEGELDYSIYKDFEALNNSDVIDGGQVEIQTSPTSTANFILDNLLR